MTTLFTGVAIWAALQTTQLIPPVLWHPMWGEATRTLSGVAPVGMISINPALTMTAIMRLLSYGAIFWLAVQLGRERIRAHEALVAVAFAGVIYATYGLIAHLGGWERILWLKKWAYPGDLTATFVNRNSYGAYAGLGVICCIALFLHAMRSRRPGEKRQATELAETVLVHALPFLAGALIIGTALLLSHSRAALACTGVALGVLMLSLVVGRVIRMRMALILGGAILAIGTMILAQGDDVTLRRIAETSLQNPDQARTNVYRLVFSAISDAPWNGHGFGAFRHAFAMYQDGSLADPGVWEYAHNIPLEQAMELGLPATVALYGSFGLILAGCAVGLIVRRRDHIYPAVALSAATLLGTHSTVDFSAQMPAVAATLALLFGIGYAQSWSTKGDVENSPQPPKDATPA